MSGALRDTVIGISSVTNKQTVNHISTRGKIIPTTLLLAPLPQIFRPSYCPDNSNDVGNVVPDTYQSMHMCVFSWKCVILLLGVPGQIPIQIRALSSD